MNYSYVDNVSVMYQYLDEMCITDGDGPGAILSCPQSDERIVGQDV